MYYNIKIITKDSEFGLESSDKFIIEREMDLYFARFFGASEEFKSKIKKVQITRPEVKSINEFNTIQNTQKVAINEPKPEITPRQISQPETINEFKPASYEENRQKIDNIFNSNPVSSNTEHVENTNETEADDELAQITGSYITKKDIQITQKDDNAELEKEAHALYEQLQQQVKSETQIANHTKPERKSLTEPDNSDTKYAFQDIVDTYNQCKSEPPVQIPVEEKNAEPDDADIMINEDIQKCIEECSIRLNNEPVVIEDSDEEEIIKIDDFQADTEKTQEQEPSNAAAQNQEETQKEQPDLKSISFNSFLSGFTTDSIDDEFLICASYIKNILQENDFTMKYINSKIFQATGKIADTSVVDQLIQKEYIKTIMVDDYTKYAITPKGESYLASKLPG